jgi:hypothetical protein
VSAPRRRLAVGLVVTLAYAAVALWAWGPPVRPLFDGIGPAQPYRWVNPPAAFAPTNQPPGNATHTVLLTAVGSDAASISTSPDAQAAIILKEGTFPPRKGETAVVVKIDPLDPATIGPPPAGMRYDGNAYRFIAAYKKSGIEPPLTQPATVVLTFPLVATKLLRRDGNVWTDLTASPVATSLQIFANTTKLGVFVAVGPPLNTKLPSKGTFPAALVISLGAAAAAVVAGLFARLRGRRRRTAKQRTTKTGPGKR